MFLVFPDVNGSVQVEDTVEHLRSVCCLLIERRMLHAFLLNRLPLCLKLLQEERQLHEAEAELHARAKLLGKSAGAMRHRVESDGVQPGVCESCGQPVSAEHLTTHLGRLESDERRAQATPLCYTSVDDRGYV